MQAPRCLLKFFLRVSLSAHFKKAFFFFLCELINGVSYQNKCLFSVEIFVKIRGFLDHKDKKSFNTKFSQNSNLALTQTVLAGQAKNCNNDNFKTISGRFFFLKLHDWYADPAPRSASNKNKVRGHLKNHWNSPHGEMLHKEIYLTEVRQNKNVTFWVLEQNKIVYFLRSSNFFHQIIRHNFHNLDCL